MRSILLKAYPCMICIVYLLCIVSVQAHTRTVTTTAVASRTASVFTAGFKEYNDNFGSTKHTNTFESNTNLSIIKKSTSNETLVFNKGLNSPKKHNRVTKKKQK